VLLHRRPMVEVNMKLEDLPDCDLYHVYPVHEEGHVVDDWNGYCWCGAKPDAEVPSVVIHNEGMQA